MTRPTNPELVRAAIVARKFAQAPYSRFRVGAAILTSNGRVITGCNIENSSYGLTCCAERVALFKALSEGFTTMTKIAVVAATRDGPTPCGACRQLLAEYMPEATVLAADSRRPKVIQAFTVRELLPFAFDKRSLGG